MNEVLMVVEEMDFIRNDAYFNELLVILTDFSKHQCYYYIDTIVSIFYFCNVTF